MTENTDTMVIKSTSKGLVVDTIISSKDSFHITANYHTTVSIPDNTINVILPEKSNLEIFSTWAIIIGGLAGLAGAFVAFWQLFRKDKIKERQIEELIKQTRINQARLRMLVKPRIWSNGGGWVNERIGIDINNRGELGFYDGYEILEGDKLEFSVWRRPIDIEKDGQIKLTAPFIQKAPKDVFFRIKIFYHDQENFNYETIFDWKGGVVTFVETIEK